jgi:Zn finger protein HypA/HybF involved in hydrogenase expression
VKTAVARIAKPTGRMKQPRVERWCFQCGTYHFVIKQQDRCPACDGHLHVDGAEARTLPVLEKSDLVELAKKLRKSGTRK